MSMKVVQIIVLTYYVTWPLLTLGNYLIDLPPSHHTLYNGWVVGYLVHLFIIIRHISAFTFMIMHSFKAQQCTKSHIQSLLSTLLLWAKKGRWKVRLGLWWTTNKRKTSGGWAGLSSAQLEISLVLVKISYYRAKDCSESIYSPNSDR